MSEREKSQSDPYRNFDLDSQTRLFREPSLTRPAHAEPPVNERAATMSVSHRVGYPTVTKPSAVRPVLSHAVIHFLVNAVVFRYQPVLPPDH